MHGLPFTIGLTGGIGSGKSSAAALFTQSGAAVVDADAISRTLTGPQGEAVAEIRRAFGPRFVTADGALDRAAMRALIFSDVTARRRLEALLHPLIALRAREAIQRAARHSPYVIYDCPLIAEKPALAKNLSRLLVIDAPPALQISRVVARSGLSPEEALAVIRAQADRAVRLALADDVIVNADTLEALACRVRALDAFYRTLARRNS